MEGEQAISFRSVALGWLVPLDGLRCQSMRHIRPVSGWIYEPHRNGHSCCNFYREELCTRLVSHISKEIICGNPRPIWQENIPVPESSFTGGDKLPKLLTFCARMASIITIIIQFSRPVTFIWCTSYQCNAPRSEALLTNNLYYFVFSESNTQTGPH